MVVVHAHDGGGGGGALHMSLHMALHVSLQAGSLHSSFFPYLSPLGLVRVPLPWRMPFMNSPSYTSPVGCLPWVVHGHHGTVGEGGGWGHARSTRKQARASQHTPDRVAHS